MDAIEVRGLTQRYGALLAVDHVSFAVRRGEVFGFLGPNSDGKLGALAFAALGVLLAARSTDTHSEVMMLSNLVRLPLIFVSGVLVPIDRMPR